MSWVVEQKRTWAEWLVLRVLKVGPIPQHVAIIMDGNRRYARRENKNTLVGHSKGFIKLTEVLSWCRDLGINEVTAYAFSIENFKRSKEEVEGLWDMAAEKFEKLLEEKDKLREHGVCIRVIGNISLLPPRVRKIIAESMLMTRGNDKCFLNLALAYTSREEMAHAAAELAAGVDEGILEPLDVTEELLEQSLYTAGHHEPDLLVRTSGEVRLSDFLLWQSAYSCLFFTKVLWPDFTIWHLFAAVFWYQRYYHTLKFAREQGLLMRRCNQEELDMKNCRHRYGSVTPEQLSELVSERMKRNTAFLFHLQQKRINYLQHQRDEML